MTQEQKAKAYDEAVKKLRVLRDDWATTQNRAAKEVEEIFPELKESEEERIKESITEFFKNYSKNGTWKAIPDVTKWIAWLEKQGERDVITFNNAHIIDHALNDYCCKQYDALYKENGGVMSFARLQHLAMDIYAWCKKQVEQKPYGQRAECLDCQFNYAGECKGSCAMKRGKQKPVSKDFEMALAEMIDKAQKNVIEPLVVAAQWKDELIELAKSEEPVSEDEAEKRRRI